MNAEDSLKLARRFIGLPLEKRQLFLQALQKEGVDFSRFPIPAGVEVEDRQALSYAQQRMWFLWQLDPASGAYNLPGAVRLKGALNLDAMEQAFASLVARHETLRTVFQRQADERLLQVATDTPLTVEHDDLSHLAPAEREQAVDQAATRQSLLPFDLENGPLLRVQLLKLDAQEHVLLLTLHHIVSDGWSMNVLIDEFIRFYDAHERNQTPQLPALPIQYSDYALWQRRWLEAGEQARQLEYWQARLGDEHPVLELPTDRPRPAMPSYQGTRHNFAIDPQLAAQLRACAQQHNVTLFMLLLGAFNVLLHRYTGQGDIRVGVPIANRNRTEVEGLIGFFVNTQVLRTELTGQTLVTELLQGIKEHALGAQAHQELPFERLVEALKVERSLSHTPLFQVMYNHQPVVADIANVSTASGLALALVEWQGRTTQFDLTLDTYEKSGTLHAALTYANDLFDAPTIERMAGHWISLLRAMVADGGQRIGELPMLAADEQQVLVHTWNQTAEAYPTERGIHHLIEDQVHATPDAPALAFGATTLTYAQLDARANQLAHALREQGVGPDVLVGICVERSIEMVVGLLAILKAGGAYVPLDPEYPRERLAYMIEDSGIQLLLSQQRLLPSLPVASLQVIALDQPALWLDGYSSESPAVAIQALNLAYVIYTSGSTGKPKGAGNSHRALVNRLCWMQQAYGLDASDAVLQKTPFSFDVSVWEFFWPLMAGARLVVAAPGEHREPARLIETIGQHGITTLHFVPSMLQAFIHEPGVQACGSLQRIVCSGEALPLDAQLQVFAKLPRAGLFNLYGPTEAAIDVTHWTCIDEGADSVPIGRPIANLGTYVLDAQLNPVAAGVSGELYLGGTGLARSYHRRPALTAERFVPSPFGDGARLYRTGDRVRQRADGVIDYLGRLDHQVKLRGLRIELGEIEARLMQHPSVREAVVLVQGGKQLVAYLVLEDQAPADLKAWLLSSLPEYMVPTHMVPLAKLPVTANGKLDRKALPLPDAAPQQVYIAPQNHLQKALAAIWSDVLGVEQVGLDDNFFELGGDSIISIQVVSRARQAGIRLSPRDLFQYQSVRSLALVAGFEQATVIDQGPVSGEVILTPVQHSFFEHAIPARQHWNQSLLLTPREALEPARLDAALTRLINHHDALRLRFSPRADGWQQAHAAPVASASMWQSQVADEAELAALCDEAQRSLDLEQGPLMRAVLVTMADGAQRLLLVVHHLAVDGVSWRILLEDLQQAYRNAALPAKTSAYQVWAQQLQAHAQTLDDQLPYWQAQTASADLPCDNPQGGLQNRLGSKLEIRLTAEHTRQLLQDAPGAYRTQVNDLLLTALARVISRWSGQSAALIQLEGHGREDLFDTVDLSRTVGWFTSLFPVCLHAEGELSAAIKSVKEQLRAVPHKGIGYGLLRYLGTPDARETLSGLAAPRITFNYLGQFDRQFNESALFVPATQGSGQAQDPEAPLANWLTVEGQVYGGELALQWGFSREMFEVATVQRLAEDFQQELLALIAHCVDPKQGGLTPADVTLARLTQSQLDDLALPAREVQDLYPLSPMQQGMLFHSLYQQDEDDIYVSQLRADIHGLDVPRFQRAWEQVLARHDMLRTGFVWQQGQTQPLQAVYRVAGLPFAEYDWQALPDQHAALDALSESTRAQGFVLEQAPLLSLKLVRTGVDRFHLIYTNHHILLDGWSRAQLFGEVLECYAGRPLPTLQGHYRDYIGWLQAQESAASEAFWKDQLVTMQEPTRLARGAGSNPSAAKGSYALALSIAQTDQLKGFAQTHKITLNTLVQAAWLLLLQRQTGQDTVVFGATVSGRPAGLPGVEQQVGLFINTLPVIATPSPMLWVGEWLQQVQALNLSLREHEHTPLFDIQRWAGTGGAALFDTLLVFENYPVSTALAAGAPAGLTFSHVQNFEQTHYPLTVLLGAGAALEFDFSFDVQSFGHDEIRQLAESFQHLLHGLTSVTPRRVGEVPSLTDAVRRQVVEGWNATQRDYPQGQWVHQLFEAQALVQPEAPALRFNETTLSYSDLNSRANRLAHRLIEAGVGPDVLVGLAVERSIEMVVGLLAVLKAGGAYVPLDPEYPRERLAYMLEDSGVKLLLTQAHLLDQLPIPDGLESLVLGDSAFEAYSDANPGIALDGENLAYVIYTSGSTGQPKGAGNRHSALLNRLQWMQDAYGLDISDTVLQKTPFSFDVSVWEFFWPLMTGSRLVVAAPGDHRDPAKLVRLINAEHVTTLHFVPSMLQVFLQDPAVWSCQSLQRIVCSGEALPVDAQQQVFAKLPQARLYNLYGPTEAAIDVTHWTCVDEGRDAVPIGRPIANLGCYILDSNFEPVPVGVLGELYLGGVGLARGYHRRPSLTAERFIAHPFIKGERLYRTGDLARYRENGVIEYAGRIDHQVKLRGLRIELGEIEARLLEHDWVREAAVLAVDGNYLVGYLVLHNAGDDWRDVLSAHLAQHLPDYMVPAQWMLLEQMPLGPNGKLDRKALPKPEAAGGEYITPLTEREQQIAAIWAEVLGVERVGLNDHFFERGGHSLIATQAVSRIRHGLGLDVGLKALFDQPVLGLFVRSLTQAHVESTRMERVEREQPLGLSYAQERQWFLWQLDPRSAAYHVPRALRLKGQLDCEALQRAFDTLVARHESLRTHLQQDAGRTVQVISPPARIEIALADADEASLKAQVEASITQPFDLRQGPLMRVRLLRLAQDEHVLVLVQHHIISDGWSMQVMVDELVQLYAAYSRGEGLQLPALPIQYVDYALWQRSWMEAGEKARQLDYWREVLGGEQPVLELPFDHQRPAVPTHRGARLHIPLPIPLLDSLKALAQREGVTLFMLLLASYQVLLHRYSGQPDIRVGVPIANRNRVETERLIGFFVNTQVLKAEIDGHTTVSQLLAQVKQRALEAQAHQDLPFEQLVEALQPERSLSLNPLFQVAFNHHISLAGQHLQRLGQLEVSPMSWDEAVAQFDLTLDIEESREQLNASLSYATDLFEASTIERMARHWQNLLQAMVADQQQNIGQLQLLDGEEQQHIIQLWNQTDAGFPAKRLVHELVADRARETPTAVAVKFDAQTLSYGELDRQANRLAHALIARGVGPEVRVAIAMPRSAEIMVAFLAVMKAGGVYVPLDIEYPRDRLLYMMQDSRAQLLLTHTSALQQLPIPDGLDSLAIDRTEEWAGFSDTAPQVTLDGDNLAYVIYTSGSTGMPKGVAVSHGPLVAHIIATGERYETSPADCELHFMSFAFDGSHEGWMHPLINGASVLIRDDSLWLPEYTYQQMHRHNVTMAVFPPVYLQQLAEHAERDGNPPKVRVYCFGGDAVAQASYDLAWRALKPTYLFNGYGPTETVVTPLLWKARKGDPCGAVYAPIGTLLGNRSGYVLDSQLNLQPIGVAGELYLGGEGVARGYLERPALTAERFVPDPYGKPGSRVYRSGDLTRGRPDGVVDYLGRVDHQVKIRGFRIELGEIEARLREQDNVGETVVVAQDGPTGKQLVAYVVPADGPLANETEFRETLRRALKINLPDYMVPAHFMFLAQMPLTPNGKLDRKGLPQPDVTQSQGVFVEPVTPLQQQVAAIWADVLGVERIGLTDHFFELGGHSLLAMQVISRLRQLLAREVALRTLFEQPQLEGFVLALQALDNTLQVPSMVAVSRARPLALSYAQERQWFLWQLEPESAAYHVPNALRLSGQLDRSALQRSFDVLLARHEALRTVFVTDGEHTLQHILPIATLQLDFARLEGASAQQVQARVEAEIARPFDLRQGPLLRVKLLQLSEQEHVLVLVQHHIVSDGWSMQVMVDELVQLYAGFSQGRPAQLPAIALQYADYAAWQRGWMDAGERQRQLDYWRELLGGEQPVLELPLDHPRPAVQSYRGALLEVGLDSGLVTGLKALAQREGVTLFMLLLASFQTLLHRYSGRSDIRVGVPIANRNRAEIERLIGFFVNTQVLKVDIDGQMTFAQLLQQVKRRALDAQANQDLPFEQLVEALQPERSLSHNPLFQVMFNHQSEARVPRGEQLPGLRVEGLTWDSQTAHFDLSLDTQESSDGLWASLTYATDLFGVATIARLAQHWQNLLEGVARDALQPIGELALLDHQEQVHLLQEWNSAAPACAIQQGVQHLFEHQAQRRPDAVALCLGARSMRYGELNLQANRLAHALIAQGVGPEVLVGVAVERSFEMVVSLLAVLKAGGAYVPLDPQYPRERLLHMLEDSGVRLVLIQSHIDMPLPEGMATLDLSDADLTPYPQTNPQVTVDPQNLAYVIYTSGSTGKPKGVAINHAALTEFSSIAAGYSRLTQEDCVLQFATLNFDGFVEQLYPALTHGATVVLRGPELWDSARLYEEIISQGITLADLPTAYWNLFLLDCLAAGPRSYGALRQIHIGGEAMPLDGPAQWLKVGLGRVRLLNTYGPTEATVVSSVLDCTSGTETIGATASPIGRSVPGRALYVLDRDLNLAPLGAVGDLYIGSHWGLARAYLNRASLTAERFVPDPFGQTGERLYRTGDLARYRADGVIECVGRVDHQVKIRGFRIELGEIEALLLAQDGVRETLVLAADNQLVAYVVAEQQDGETLKNALREQLPDYMVPAHLIFLDRMPLNPNGKMDRQALPKPDASQSQQAWVAPVTELEQQVAAVWADILGAERVGLTDHFFEMGGHSLLAMQVVSRLRNLLGREVALRSLFEQPRLQGFVAALSTDSGMPLAPALVAVGRDQPLPLSYAQERQWFLWQLDPSSAAYHVPSALRLKGRLDLSALQRSFDTLVARHENLRTYLQQDGERAVQVIAEQASVEVARVDIGASAIRTEVESQIARPFDLTQGPLMRASLLRVAEDDHVLVLVQHHIVSDGWSMQVMVDELVQLYAAFSLGQAPQLPALPIQYADYAVWQRQWMEAGEKTRQLEYWRGLLGGEQPVLELPLDHARPSQQSHRGASLDIQVPPALVTELRALAQREDVTLFMLLLASFQALLHRYSGQSDIRVGVPVANRNRVETERLIGFFVNTQVLKADIDGQQTVAQLLAQVKQRALDAQAHQDLPFEQLVEALQPERNLSFNPLFQVLFNHQTQASGRDEDEQLPGLQVSGLEWDNHTAQFDLSLNTHESAEGLAASLTYATDLFELATLARMAAHWLNLLNGMTRDAQQRIGQLPLLEPQEQQAAVHDWNSTAREYPLQRCVHQLIEEQVLRTPDAPALVFGQQCLDYAELNHRTNRLAHRLIEAGVGPDVLVGLAVERSIEMVIGLLAVLKAGGAYVPLDPEYPRERLAYMLEDSGVKLLLTQAHLLDQLPIPSGLETLVLGGSVFERYSEENPGIVLHGENLAYVIYTSGSTGQPKGAGNRHSALTNRLCWMQEAYGLNARDSVLQKTPFSFDVSVWEFFWPLMTGSRLVVAAPGDHRDPQKLVALINAQRITTLHFVPSMLQAFLQDSAVASCHSLQRIVCSGEALPVDAQQQVFAKLPQADLYNLYGPTEAAIDVTHWTCRDEGCDTVPIGEPIANLRTYVLDADLAPVPVGVAGELYLGGAGLARSYHRRPALTAERFVPCPFHNGARLYRTGDRVRQRANGVIEYLGRLDHQVKLRGLRIELGEIEARLLEHPVVREATVLAVDGKHLVGYLVLQQAGDDWRERLSAYLASHVPDYMVPAQWVVLEQMPLSPNGKLDRKALPRPQASDRDYVAPQTGLEQQLAAVWAQVLEVERVGLHDNFFELGGHSLLVLLLKDRIHKACGVTLAVNQLMLHPTIAGQARCIEGDVGGSLIVRLNSQTQGTPLYLFHPSFGSVHCYKAIALALREQRPVLGVICRTLVEEGVEVPTWAQMVEDYTQQLLLAQPHGAFRLGGWSLGGNLAMEVAYRLEQAGRTVELLGWIDAPPPARFTAFWQEGARVDERVISAAERRVDLLAVMFPAYAEQIRNVWHMAAGEQDEQWQRVSEWAELTLGDSFRVLKDELQIGGETERSWALKQVLDERLQDADYRAIKAPVNCWWAALSEGGIHQALIETGMREVIGQSGIQRSVVIDTTHHRIVDNAEFISSFVSAME